MMRMPDKTKKKLGDEDEFDSDAVDVPAGIIDDEEEESEWEGGGGDTDEEEDF